MSDFTGMPDGATCPRCQHFVTSHSSRSCLAVATQTNHTVSYCRCPLSSAQAAWYAARVGYTPADRDRGAP